MTARWWKRLWLRYLFYWKQHWVIAASLTLSLLWLLAQAAIQFLPTLVELALEALLAAL